MTLTPIAMLATAAVLSLTALWMLALYRRECSRSRQMAVAFRDLEATLVATQQKLHRAEGRQLRAERRARKLCTDLVALEAEQARFLARVAERPRPLLLSLDSELVSDYRQALGNATSASEPTARNALIRSRVRELVEERAAASEA